MKIYSDSLTDQDLYQTLPQGVHIERLVAIRQPKVRKHGWIVQLTGSSTRHRNSGSHGAATWESKPATYDEYGYWMAELFDRDPEARITYYEGRDQFHAMTKNQYRVSV